MLKIRFSLVSLKLESGRTHKYAHKKSGLADECFALAVMRCASRSKTDTNAPNPMRYAAGLLNRKSRGWVACSW
jgi:hypothetical protein